MYYGEVLRSIRDYKINFIIKVMILSDFLIFSSINLLAPVFAIFVIDEISGATLQTVGIATALYWIFKSIFQLFVGAYVDSTKSEKDDLYTALAGIVLTAAVYFVYRYIENVWQLYVMEAMLGFAAALGFPGRYAIFTRHIDKKKEAFEWSMYDVIVGLGIAASAALGAFLADAYGFRMLFLIVSLFNLWGGVILLTIRRQIKT